MTYPMKALLGATATVAAACLGACKCPAPEQQTIQIQQPVIGGETRTMPQAVVYRVNTECADLVPVTVGSDGKTLLSYPAPTDLNPAQMPLQLGDGWWLDRRGIGPQTKFTTYTYAQYMALKQAPTPTEILAHIDPEARITRMISLPVDASRAAAEPQLARNFIEDGFKGCVELIGPDTPVDK